MQNIKIDKDGIPRSVEFDDVYYSVDNGLAEARYVFLEGNDFLRHCQRQDRNVIRIVETGFGTGLNFLAVLSHWHDFVSEDKVLEFISVERYPLDANIMRSALANWQELAEFSAALLECYQNDGDELNISFPQYGCKLRVIFADVNQVLDKLPQDVDMWFLDGFAPAKNPQMWTQELFAKMYRNTASSGTFATFTAAGMVKRGLQAAGFQVEKRPGFGRKRDMLIGGKNAG
jgi:tRNA 5-methylaminomethyl-2-thiouridine biosynthesis bifunctional protein